MLAEYLQSDQPNTHEMSQVVSTQGLEVQAPVYIKREERERERERGERSPEALR
jgi:hypothetical protein